MKEREAYSSRPDGTQSKKSNKINTGKICQFARCFIHPFIRTVVKYFEPLGFLQIASALNLWILTSNWTSVELKIQIRTCDVTFFWKQVVEMTRCNIFNHYAY